jgi:hypothetical protein
MSGIGAKNCEAVHTALLLPVRGVAGILTGGTGDWRGNNGSKSNDKARE